ncbi:MAG TPA: hypothetical protein VFW35_03180 [Sphingomicrobium sp.]|nr:hypothetical protein [Sphingomicrobium sp.]
MTDDRSTEAKERVAANPAGGKAGGRGLGFQADVATWFAVHLLTRQPAGGRVGINNSAVPVAIRLETGEALDDIEVEQSDGGRIHVQAKTRPTLSTAEAAGLSKTLGQLARWVADEKSAARSPDATRTVAVLAVRADAARSLDHLHKACRAFDLGGEWKPTKKHRNANEQRALGLFENLAGGAWTKHRAAPAADADLAEMAWLFRIERFSMEEGQADWREASRLLSRHLYGGDDKGDAALRDLRAIVYDMIGTGAPADRNGLLRALRRKGHIDVGAPGFDADIERLKAVTTAELARLADHARLPLDGGIPLVRSSDGPLVAAIQSGSALIVGEPGAGKTGALVNAANAIASAGDTILFLSVDRYPGVAIASDLQSELRLDHPLLDVLENFPGPGPKILFIDALDAARGGPSEHVFAALIEDVRAKLADSWTVIASIRTFDLKNGRRYAKTFAGQPVDPHFAEPGLDVIRHFLVPRLSEGDLTAAGTSSPRLGKLLTAAPPPLRSLLHNIFNLSLAAELVDSGADPSAFSAVKSQSGLIDAYEDVRLPTTFLRRAAAATVAAMIERRRLMVLKTVVQHDGLDQLIGTGVAVDTEDRVSFAHHVLFDHVAGRFYLERDQPAALARQLSGDATTALLLAPALRFTIEREWRRDVAGKTELWAMLDTLFGTSEVDAVLTSVALRTAVESVANADDVDGLLALIKSNPASPSLASMLGRLSRFVDLEIDSAGLDAKRGLAWARIADAAIASGERGLVDAGRFLLQTLFQKADLYDADLLPTFGRASRALLIFAWDSSPRLSMTATNAVRFVGKSFASDPAASKALLGRILEEPHFSSFADQEASWVAEQIVPILRSDPEFAGAIFAALFGKGITDDSVSHFGGAQSRIMPLSSNRRQDFEHSRWELGCAMATFLEAAPKYGTRAFIDSEIGEDRDREPIETIDLGASRSLELRHNDYELNPWNAAPSSDRPQQDDDRRAQYVAFLRGCTPDVFAVSANEAAEGYATPSTWSRIFGVAAERHTEVADAVWPYAVRPGFLTCTETMRDAITFISAAYPGRTPAERESFERTFLDQTSFEEDYEKAAWEHAIGRLLNLIEEKDPALDAARELRRKLQADGKLIGNTPLSSFEVGWGDSSGIERELLRRDGVDPDHGPHAEVMAGSDAVDELLQQTPQSSDAVKLAALWTAAISLIALLDRHEADLHEKISRAGWGRVASAAERITGCEHYSPGLEGLPELAELIGVLDRLAASPFPIPKEAKTDAELGK